MIKNYFKIAFRSLKKNKLFSFINVFGLAIGLACCMFITLYVFDELSYDKYPEQAGQIYRVALNVTGNGGIDTYPDVDVAVGAGMKSTFPEILTSTRLLLQQETFIKYHDKQFKEQKLVYADSNFLQLFSIPLIEGDTYTALKEPNSIVITKAFATKYFGREDPIGKSLIFEITPFKVTGVIDKVPDNSHFHFDCFMSMSTRQFNVQTWSNVGFYTYLIINKNVNPTKLEAKFPDLVAKYVVPEVAQDMGVSLAEAKKSISTFRFFLQPLTTIHLYANSKYELEANGDIKYVYIFSALAIFILLLACINFTNLSTANAAKRAREVGVRKVMGSQKRQLVLQFLIESVIITYCAVLLSFIIVYLLTPYFVQVSGKSLNVDFFINSQFITCVLLLGLFVGLLAGFYPAFFISSFNTIGVLNGASSNSTRSRSPLRSGLVIFQFAVSTGLIIATFIIYQQLHFMQDKKLGYDKEQVLYLQDAYVLGTSNMQTAFKQALLKDSRITHVSVGSDVPGKTDIAGTQAYSNDKKENENGAEIHINIFHVDYDYLSTLGIPVSSGRNFSKDFSTDSFAVVINETAVKELGWNDTNAVNRTIVTSGQHSFKVIGVVPDFHYASVKQKVAPLMMKLGTKYRTGLIIKIKTADVQHLLAAIKKQWDTFNPGAPFSFYFLDNKFLSLYTSEQKTGEVFTLFAIAAIFIACLGLFGLATYMLRQRTKEIGIRKVFGASVMNVFVLVSKEFLLLVFISFLISIPVTWWGMHNWLQEFAYRINVQWWIFILAGVLALVIAIITVSYQTIKAAIANPVKSLQGD